MHHDTITGTSPERVIKSAMFRSESLLLRNSIALVEHFKQRANEEEGLELEGLNQCIQGPNDKYDCKLTND